MCGIAGVLNLHDPQPVAFETLDAMIAALRHRGPDEFGQYRDEWVGLASARLSIIDLSGGQQPICNEDGTLWIVFNGEIFNYIELRAGLEKCGHRFSTQSDTEVILHLYEDYGPRCLEQLNGQFAIALWDTKARSLFLARDRVGIRPLFYTVRNDRLIFGSEIKSILSHPDCPAVIDHHALRQVFAFWSPLTPLSVFQKVGEVPPGHYLLCRDGSYEVQPYWTLDFTPDGVRRADEEYLDEFEALLIDATRIRLRADVPVGAYLSGGLDSSVTATVIKRYTGAPLDTFSIAFSDEDYNESSFQQRMAGYLGTAHHEIYCTQTDIGRVFPDVIWHTEIPILRTSPAPMFLLSGLVHQHGYKVVVTGEGADEILAGYDIFKEMKLRRFWARAPQSQKRSLLFRKLYPDIPRLQSSAGFLSGFFRQDLENTALPYYSHTIRWKNTSRAWRFLESANGLGQVGVEDLAGSIGLPDNFSEWTPLGQAQYLEMATFLSPYLLSSQGDRVAMAHSVEGRYPFLDYRVVEFCGRLPDDVKLRGLNEKWLLRQLGRKLVPPEIWRRTKRPYRAPIQRSFTAGDPALDYVGDLLSPQAVREAGCFQPGPVQLLFNKARSGSRLSEVEEMALVGILSTQLVDQQFVRGSGFSRVVLPVHALKRIDRIPVDHSFLRPARSTDSITGAL